MASEIDVLTLGDGMALGVVQGLTEFLPVSSSGHLLLVRFWLGIPDTAGMALDAFLHLGTLLAVLVFYRRTWWRLGRSVLSKRGEDLPDRLLAGKLAVATVPAAIAGYVFQQGMVQWRTVIPVAIGLLVTGLGLVLADSLGRRRRAESAVGTVEQEVGFRDAVVVGLVQVLALWPGVSRSGVTMAAGQARGLSREAAVHFSFLLSAPIIAGAGLASLPTLLVGSGVTLPVLVGGLVVSFGSGLAAISLLLEVVRRWSLWPFAVYLFGLAGWLLYVG